MAQLTEQRLREILAEVLPPTLPLALTEHDAAAATGYSAETRCKARIRGTLTASYAYSKPVYRTTELHRWLSTLPTEPPH